MKIKYGCVGILSYCSFTADEVLSQCTLNVSNNHWLFFYIYMFLTNKTIVRIIRISFMMFKV